MDVMQFSLASSTCSGNEDAMKVKFMEILQDSIFMVSFQWMVRGVRGGTLNN